jgi:ABC-type sugar transport system permease subunit
MIIIVPVVIIVAIIAWMLRPKKTMTKSRIFSIFAVIIPSFIVAVAAIVFQLFYNAENDGVANISNTLFITGFGIIGAAILALIGLAIIRKWETAKGIGFGICIAVIISVIALGLLEWLGGV